MGVLPGGLTVNIVNLLTDALFLAKVKCLHDDIIAFSPVYSTDISFRSFLQYCADFQ